MTWLYGIQSGLFIKIGCTNSIPKRLKQMNALNPHPCKVVVRRQLHGDAYIVEKRMHQTLAPYAIGREWFMVDARLVRAALTVVLKEVRAEHVAWLIECARKPVRKSTIAVEFGIDVERDTRQPDKKAKSNA